MKNIFLCENENCKNHHCKGAIEEWMLIRNSLGSLDNKLHYPVVSKDCSERVPDDWVFVSESENLIVYKRPLGEL